MINGLLTVAAHALVAEKGPYWDHPSVLITGYENYPLVDGSALLTDPVFWAIHTLTAGATGLDDLESCFGVDVDDAEELCEQLFDHDHWPVLSLPLRSRAAIHVIYRNLDGDMGLDYMLSHPDWPNDLQLAAVEGCFVGPGLSWRELISIADQPPTSMRPALLTPAGRLLLLLPALGDADLPDTAVHTVTTALNQITTSPAAHQVAEILLQPSNAYWKPAHWQQLPNGAMVCDESHSRRSPAHPRAFTTDQALAITQALAGA